jgi:hypothetical protein
LENAWSNACCLRGRTFTVICRPAMFFLQGDNFLFRKLFISEGTFLASVSTPCPKIIVRVAKPW